MEPGRPGGPEQRARITSHDSRPGAQQHQKAAPGRGAAAQDQLKLTENTVQMVLSWLTPYFTSATPQPGTYD